MFNMIEIGRRIAELRKKHDMTQLELADKLNISFQAVSNWERGNSMPDISKLPELSQIFDISLDALLGTKADFLEAVLKNQTQEYLEAETADTEEIADALPLLKPTQMQEVAQQINLEKYEDIDAFLPFMDEDDVAEFAHKAIEKGENIDKFLPYLYEDDITEIAKCFMEKGKSIDDLLPFMDEDDIMTLARNAAEKGESVRKFLPFLYEDDVKELALKAITQ